jgi:hypothetical protein
MKKVLLFLLFTTALTICTASDKEIIAEVVFENTTGKTFTTGSFYITETNKRLEINTLESFKITLPAKGKYLFSFSTPDFTSYTIYPAVINDRKNTITVRLVEKKELVSTVAPFSKPFTANTALTEEQIKQQIVTGQVYFIMHGIDNSIPDEYIAFQKKYGIGLKKENCVLDPLSFKRTIENNQIIANYLNNKYGNSWMLDLTVKPFGLK